MTTFAHEKDHELFARRRRYGWDVWGNEAPEFAASQAEMGLVG
jgi:N6-adenosine-specific RNA methylase IME4